MTYRISGHQFAHRSEEAVPPRCSASGNETLLCQTKSIIELEQMNLIQRAIIISGNLWAPHDSINFSYILY